MPTLYDPSLQRLSHEILSSIAFGFSTCSFSAALDWPSAKELVHVGYVPFDEQLDAIAEMPETTFQLSVDCSVIDWAARMDRINALPNIIGLIVHGAEPKMEELQALEHVWDLSCSSSNGSLVLSQLPKIRALTTDFDRSTHGIEEAPWIEYLRLHNSMRRTVDFAPLAQLHALKMLVVFSGRVVDFDALAGHPSLQKLSVNTGAKLESVAALATLPTLREIWIDEARQVQDWGTLAQLPALEALDISYAGKITLPKSLKSATDAYPNPSGGTRVEWV